MQRDTQIFTFFYIQKKVKPLSAVFLGLWDPSFHEVRNLTFLVFFAIFDLCWPLLTLKLSFLKALANSFILGFNLSTFGDVRNLTQNGLKCPRMTSGLFLRLPKNIFTKNNYAVILFEIKQMCFSEVSYFTLGVKFQKMLLTILKSIKSKADSQIFKTFWPQKVS